MDYLQAIILAIIEGITEFLPISSTGHMIIASSFFGIAQEDFTKLFTVVIQLGAILSVVVLYFKRFFQTVDFYFKLLVAFIPAVIFGLLFGKKIDALLENPITVAISLVIGGVILLKVDDWFSNSQETQTTEKISYGTAFKWIKEWGEKVSLPKSTEPIEIVELDEMHTYIMSKKTTVGYGLLLIDLEKGMSILCVETDQQKHLKNSGKKLKI